jgi:hypothetical protein
MSGYPLVGKHVKTGLYSSEGVELKLIMEVSPSPSKHTVCDEKGLRVLAMEKTGEYLRCESHVVESGRNDAGLAFKMLPVLKRDLKATEGARLAYKDKITKNYEVILEAKQGKEHYSKKIKEYEEMLALEQTRLTDDTNAPRTLRNTHRTVLRNAITCHNRELADAQGSTKDEWEKYNSHSNALSMLDTSRQEIKSKIAQIEALLHIPIEYTDRNTVSTTMIPANKIVQTAYWDDSVLYNNEKIMIEKIESQTVFPHATQETFPLQKQVMPSTLLAERNGCIESIGIYSRLNCYIRHNNPHGGPGGHPTDIKVANKYGYLYIACENAGVVLLTTPDGCIVNKISLNDNGDGRIFAPLRIALSTGWLYVVDYINDRVSVFDESKGVFERHIGAPVHEKYKGLREPTGVAVSQTHVFVTQAAVHHVCVFNVDGTFEKIIGSDVAMKNPHSLALSTEHLYVINDTQTVFIFSLLDFTCTGTFKLLTKEKTRIPDTGKRDITVKGDRVFVLDPCAHRVLIYTLEGLFVNTMEYNNSRPERSPSDSAFAFDGYTMYIAEADFNIIRHFT